MESPSYLRGNFSQQQDALIPIQPEQDALISILESKMRLSTLWGKLYLKLHFFLFLFPLPSSLFPLPSSLFPLP
jgi:hypothetical protein